MERLCIDNHARCVQEIRCITPCSDCEKCGEPGSGRRAIRVKPAASRRSRVRSWKRLTLNPGDLQPAMLRVAPLALEQAPSICRQPPSSRTPPSYLNRLATLFEISSRKWVMRWQVYGLPCPASMASWQRITSEKASTPPLRSKCSSVSTL